MSSTFGHNQETGKAQAWNVKESVLLPAGDTETRVDFDPNQFQRLIEQKGIRVCVYRTSYCPRVKSWDSAEHEIDCQLCNGSGWLDKYPIATKALIVNQDLEKLATTAGMVDGNTVSMSFPTGIELQYMTRVDLEDFTDIYIQRVLRRDFADSPKDILKYRAKRVNFITDFSGNDYYQDQDFKIDPNGDILWFDTGDITTARNPADGAIYTIHYEAPVQFRAVKAGHVNRFIQVLVTNDQVEHLKMPEQWLMAKEFLVRRKDAAEVDLKPGPYDTHTEVVDT